jgi:hypothetical protein
MRIQQRRDRFDNGEVGSTANNGKVGSAMATQVPRRQYRFDEEDLGSTTERWAQRRRYTFDDRDTDLMTRIRVR